MFKERSTDKLIEYIQSLPDREQEVIAKGIEVAKTPRKTTRPAQVKLSSLKGKVSRSSAARIDKRIKSLRNEWQRDI